MEETTLLFRHLPSELTDDERKDLLHYLGATQVKVMERSGCMKNTAFASFATKEQATRILHQLHQADFLGSKLVVEFAKKNVSQIPSVIDREGVKKFEDDEDKKLNNTQIEPQEVKFDTTFNTWGLKHPRRPELKYLYPPPTPSILRNIMHALAAVPKFYVQVLHLMNKMDLPAPFGPVTLTPPMHPDVHQGIGLPDDVDQKEMDISSGTESELDSNDDSSKEVKPKEEKLCKRPLRSAGKQLSKRPKLSDLHDPVGDILPVSAPIQVNEVFEQVSSSGQKKIELKLPSMLLQPTPSRLPPVLSMSQPLLHSSSGQSVDSSHDFSEPQLAPPVLPPEDAVMPDVSTTEDSYDVPLPPQSTQTLSQQLPSVIVGGFGVMEPVHKEVDKNSAEEHKEKEWTKSKFVSSSELKKLRLSHSEMSELSVFKRYEEGEPSCRLYLKNLAKNVTEEDIHWVYGRYVDWDNEMETTIFDIRLMKTGRMKGQGFITLPSEKAAIAALKETNGFLLKDKPLVVQFARSAKAQEDEPKKLEPIIDDS